MVRELELADVKKRHVVDGMIGGEEERWLVDDG